MLDKISRKRTLIDKFICESNRIRYGVLEPIMLAGARLRNERFYKNDGENPLISVYTPTYNRAKILAERALPSVLAQTYKNFEFIILGDCCTDETEKMVSQIKDSRVKFYNLPKRGYRYPSTVENHWLAGPVTAANAALKLVRGKWIARLDDDDTWTPDHLEELLRFAQEGNYEFVSAQIVEERYGVQRISDGNFAQSDYYHRDNKPIRGENPRINGPSTWLYRSYLKFFKYNINCWRKGWNRVNDIDFALRVFRAGARLGFLAKPLAGYLPRPGEKTVGLEAYQLAEAEKLKHFEFRSNK